MLYRWVNIISDSAYASWEDFFVIPCKLRRSELKECEVYIIVLKTHGRADCDQR